MRWVIGLCLFTGIISQLALEAKLVVSQDVAIWHSVTSIGMSEDGRVLFGESGTDFNHAGLLIWTWSDGTKTDLGKGRLYDISTDGSVVVGEIRHPAPGNYPYYYYGEAAFWKDGAVTPIGHLPGAEFLSSEAHLVSGNGLVIIGRSASQAGYEMFRYENGIMTGLGINGWPQAISHDGSSFIFADNSALWLWKDGSTEKFVFPGDYPLGAFDMSSDGSIVVGHCDSGSRGIPIRWENGQPTELAIPGDAPGYMSCSANFVSGNGKVIVGNLFHPIGIMGEHLIWREADSWNPVSVEDLFERSGFIFPNSLSLIAISYDGSTIIGKQYNGSSYQAVRIQLRDMFGHHLITGGVADTGDWLGRIHAIHDPWIWCEKSLCWLNIPEQTANADRGWVYPHNPDSLEIVQVAGTNWGYSYALDNWTYLSASGWVFIM